MIASASEEQEAQQQRLLRQLEIYSKQGPEHQHAVRGLIGILGMLGAAEVVDEAMKKGMRIEVTYDADADDGGRYRLVPIILRK